MVNPVMFSGIVPPNELFLKSLKNGTFRDQDKVHSRQNSETRLREQGKLERGQRNPTVRRRKRRRGRGG